MKRILLVLVIAFGLFSCTENQRAKNFGGTADVVLENGKELVNATWKDDNLWILTKERSSSKAPITYVFKEKSSFGLMTGTYVIIEK